MKNRRIGIYLLALAVTIGLSVSVASAQNRVGLELVAEGFTSPVGLVSPPDGSGRLFIVDQIGLIHIITAEGKMAEDPFLDLRNRMVTLQETFDERGLLSVAFHPDFAKNNRFFVYYSAPLREGAPEDWNHTAHISEFKSSLYNKNRADTNSEKVLLQIDEPQFNHDGGQLAFGPDGYLYIGVGDGGAANDVALGHPAMGNGQDVSTLLGTILRIDVDEGPTYAVPPDNPFVGKDGADEIYAYGLRNPWRFSFDRGGTHQLFIADVGQNLWEEVNIGEKGGNYGWNVREATHCFDPEHPNEPPDECSDTGYLGEPLIEPVIEYPHEVGTSIIGGFIYRGIALPEFLGKYIFGDWSTSFKEPDGKLFVAASGTMGEGLWSMQELQILTSADWKVGSYILALGEDELGELYVLTTDTVGPTGTTGKVYKIVSPVEMAFGGKGDVEFAEKLWEAMKGYENSLVKSDYYIGMEPHGAILRTYYSIMSVDDKPYHVVIKDNFGGEGATLETVASNPENYLAAVTVMVQREPGYDPANNDWFWVKYDADGSISKNPDGMALAGRVAKIAVGQHAGCIACHAGAKGDDFLFIND